MNATTQLEEPVDISTISVDTNLPLEQQQLEYVRQIKNPNRFCWGGITINASYNADGPTLEECLQAMIV